MIKDDNFEEIPKRAQARIVTELQGCEVIRSRRVLGGVGVGFLTTLGGFLTTLGAGSQAVNA